MPECVHINTYTYIYVYVYICIYRYIYVHKHKKHPCIDTHIYVYVWMYIYMYIYIYIYTYSYRVRKFILESAGALKYCHRGARTKRCFLHIQHTHTKPPRCAAGHSADCRWMSSVAAVPAKRRERPNTPRNEDAANKDARRALCGRRARGILLLYRS